MRFGLGDKLCPLISVQISLGKKMDKNNVENLNILRHNWTRNELAKRGRLRLSDEVSFVDLRLGVNFRKISEPEIFLV